jgi:hypothetical protein
MDTIIQALLALEKITDKEAGAKAAPHKWSYKEIIGHLIDSACNNQQKFVRTMRQPHLDFIGYEQDFWVNMQNYNDYSWKDLLAFWSKYNLHIIHIIKNTKPEVLQNTISINGVGLFTLEFIMKDYVEHLKHHLKQILPDSPFLANHFENVYNA